MTQRSWQRSIWTKRALPAAMAVALAGTLPACSDSQAPGPNQSAQSSSQQASNPCAAAPKASNPCAAGPKASNPCAAGPKASNPCAAAPKSGDAPMAAAPAPVAQGDSANPFAVDQDWTQAPYGEVVPEIVRNYGRPAPYVASGGTISEGAMGQLKELGFATVLSLITAEEGVSADRDAAEAAGLDYINLAVSTRAPTPAQVNAFADIVNNPDNYPILVHCASSNRVGAMWALYRAQMGVPAEIAIQEGRAAGLKPSREGAVREQLGL